MLTSLTDQILKMREVTDQMLPRMAKMKLMEMERKSGVKTFF